MIKITTKITPEGSYDSRAEFMGGTWAIDCRYKERAQQMVRNTIYAVHCYGKDGFEQLSKGEMPYDKVIHFLPENVADFNSKYGGFEYEDFDIV